MVLEKNTFLKVTSTKDIIRMDYQMVRVNMYGRMEIHIKVIFKMVWDGEKDFGSKKLKKGFNFIKVNM